MMAPPLAVRGGTVVAMDAARTVAARDVLIGPSGRIEAVVAPGPPAPGERTVDARGMVVVPGLVQAHVHLCQTLFRGLCEDRPLLRWLRERTWPLEAAHDAATLRASARLGIAELLLGGTTAILDMGTVHHTDALFEAAEEMGIRYTGGKAMMDIGEGVPPGLLESTKDSLRESNQLAARWHGAAGGRLRYAYCPRFVLSSTRPLLEAVAARAGQNGIMAHTHASEQHDEAAAVQRMMGAPNIQALAALGLSGPHVCLAHCVWPEPQEVDLLAASGTSVAHCPSSNLKLSSGVAPVADYLRRGVTVALGADGSPANNRLDGWEELRLAALLAKLRDGADALPARQAFELATLGGARALGLEQEIGSLEPGKQADLAVLDLRAPHAGGVEDVYTQLVFSARASDVRTVIVAGRILVADGALCDFDQPALLEQVGQQRARLVARAGIG